MLILDYDSVKKDIISWYPKVKNGGIIAGHDYNDIFEVKKAVDEIFKSVESREECWIYQKPFKEVYLVACTIKNNKQLSLLSNLVNVLETSKKDFIIVSHSILPESILKNCKSFLYDSENIMLNNIDLDFKYLFSFSTDSFEILSTTLGYGSYYNYSLAVSNLVIRGLSACKMYNYDFAHWIEYDALPNIQDNIDNIRFLSKSEEYGMVGYENVNIPIDKSHIRGSNFTINLRKLNEDIFKYDQDKIISILRNKQFIVEKFMQSEISKKPCFSKDSSIISEYDGSYLLSSERKFWYALYEVDNRIDLFLYNPTDNVVDLIIKYKSTNRTQRLNSGYWYINTLDFDLSSPKDTLYFLTDSDEIVFDLNESKTYDYYVKASIFRTL